jgi:hypothetical protein
MVFMGIGGRLLRNDLQGTRTSSNLDSPNCGFASRKSDQMSGPNALCGCRNIATGKSGNPFFAGWEECGLKIALKFVE